MAKRGEKSNNGFLYRATLTPEPHYHKNKPGILTIYLGRRYLITEEGDKQHFSSDVQAEIKSNLEKICHAVPHCIVDFKVYDKNVEHFTAEISSKRR